MPNGAERLRRIGELARSVSSTLDLTAVLDHVTAGVSALRPDAACSVRLIDPAAGGYRLARAGGVRIVGRRQVIPFGRGLTHAVAETGRPLLVEEYPSDPRALEGHWSASRGLTVYYGAPVGAAGELLGVLSVNLPAGAPPTPEEREMIETLAGQAAVAMRNARLFTRSEARRRAAESLAEISRDLAQALDPEVLAQQIVDGARDLLQSQGAILLRFDSDLSELTTTAIAGDTPAADMESPVAFAVHNVAARAIRERRPVGVPDFLVDPMLALPSEWRSHAESIPDRTLLAVPLTVQGRMIGTVVITDRTGRVLDNGDLALARAFADHAALALENARLYAEATRRRHEAEELARVARLLTESLDVATAADRIAETVLLLLRVPASVLRLRQADGSLLTIGSAGRTRDAFERGHLLPRGIGIAGKAIAEGRPVIGDPLGPGALMTEDFRRRQEASGIRRVLAVPLRVAETMLGVLAVGDEAQRVFSAGEVVLLQAFGDQAAIALNNARLFEEAERRRHSAESLAELGQLLTRSLDAAEVNQQIVDSVRSLLGTNGAVLYHVEPETQNLVSLAVSGDVGPGFTERAAVIPPGYGVVGQAVRERRPVGTPDVLADQNVVLTPELRSYVEGAAFRALLGVPLLVQGRVVGALGIGTRAGHVFDADEIRLAQTFADQAAIALENSRLYGELRAALTEVERSQQQIVQTERLSALREMAGGVAHDFNNMLAVVLGRAEMLLRRVNDPEVTRGLEIIRRAAMDGALTVRQLQEFTRVRRTRGFGAVDLEQVLHDVVELTRPRWETQAQSRGISYEVRIEGAPLPPVSGASDELREAFMNLLVNALEAMPNGGRFIFRVERQGDHVAVAAQDEGHGISERIRERIFAPFFTTKGPQRTGLGLSVAWGIVNRHGGTIEVESAPGRGSTFTLRLPVSQETSADRPSTTVAYAPKKRARVLVIEDEPDVRDVLKDLLTAEGYVVIEARDGAEGVARCEVEPVDLVLSDILMPGMSGWDVAAACRDRFPTVPVALITASGDQLDSEKLARHRIRFVLTKPFVVDDVLRAVALLLPPGEES
jgi:GAF domain-containing protein/CheY-like chemotaxis protein